jgi:small ligand-binding sensory domain FIST
VAFFGDGLAVGPDLESAARQAVAQALAPLSGPPSLVCVFVSTGGIGTGTAGRDMAERAGAAAMADAARAAGGPGGGPVPVVLGCTASGVIGGGRGVENTGAVSVWAAVLPAGRVTPFRLESARSADEIVVTGMPVPAPEDRIAVLLADPYTFPADAFVVKSADQLGGLPLTGGLAGGPPGGGVRLYLDGQVHASGAVGVLLGGSLDVATVVSQGCRPVGPPMVVTAVAPGAVPGGDAEPETPQFPRPGMPPRQGSTGPLQPGPLQPGPLQQGNEIAELAGRQALAKLEEILAALPATEQALATQGLHIGIVMDEYADQHERGDFLIRGVIGADPDAGTLTIGDVVEVGQTVRFQVRDAMTAAADLDRLLAVFAEVSGIDPVGGALLFSCNGRGATFFGTADHDVTAVLSALTPEAVGGFFAGGEIGPIGGRSHVHGFTASILMFGAGTGG